MPQMNKVFQTVLGKNIDEEYFDHQDHFYVLKFNGRIGCVMSSAWQNSKDINQVDTYYEGWPQALEFFRLADLGDFVKMGMIVADKRLLAKEAPPGFKTSPVIVGCGVRWALESAKVNGIVSFPRVDNPVYQACFDWGAMPLKTGLQLFKTPVNFILLTPHSFRQHTDFLISDEVNKLYEARSEYLTEHNAFTESDLKVA